MKFDFVQVGSDNEDARDGISKDIYEIDNPRWYYPSDRDHVLSPWPSRHFLVS